MMSLRSALRSVLLSVAALSSATGSAAAADWACCLPDGTCVELSGSDCNASGGDFHAFWYCEQIACSHGACCHEDGTCGLLSREVCSDIGGHFQGDGSACESTACPGAY